MASYTEKGEEKECSAKNIVITVGGRPVVPDDVPGAKEFAITSDDIFIQGRPPGECL